MVKNRKGKRVFGNFEKHWKSRHRQYQLICFYSKYQKYQILNESLSDSLWMNFMKSLNIIEKMAKLQHNCRYPLKSSIIHQYSYRRIQIPIVHRNNTCSFVLNNPGQNENLLKDQIVTL